MPKYRVDFVAAVTLYKSIEIEADTAQAGVRHRAPH
jgi:hypothetical protein